jgi:protein O-GlcNAc transferase
MELMAPSLQAAQLEQALRCHQQGEFAHAEALYAEVLRAEPRHRDVLHLFGVLHVQTRRLEQGVTFIRQSLQVDPRQPGAQMNLGNALRELSQPAEALASFDQALRLNPDFPEALYNRGNALADLGRLEEALASYEQAWRVRPKFAEALYQCGNVLMRLKRPQAALASYERILHIVPDHFGAIHNRGNALQEVQRPQEAVDSYERALRLDPACAEALTNRGNALRALKRSDEALASYERALSLRPDSPETWNSRGSALRDLRRPSEALASFEHALELNPDFAEALNNLGNSLRDLHRHEEAIDCYQRTIRIRPRFPDPHINWGIALRELQRPQEALARIDEGLLLDPTCVEALNNRGNVLLDLRRAAEALESYLEALRIEPAHVDTMRNQGAALQKLGRHADAGNCFRQVLTLAPDYEYALGIALDSELKCGDWRRYEESVSGILTALGVGRRSAMPFGFLAVSSSAQAQLRCAQIFAASSMSARAMRAPLHCSRYRHRRIRVAYLSADLREHVVAYLMAGVFEQHDRERFEIIGICLLPPDGSAIERRLQAAFERFIDVSGQSDAQVAALLAQLQVDIVVDLMGYTDNSRTAILAARAAPVQVNYLGYPGTMGASFMDYIIADEFVIARGSREHYAERVVYLPECFQANDDRRLIGPTPTREQAGLPGSGFVWCCFNSAYKLNPRMFDIWCRLLEAVPGSVLWLVGESEAVRENLWREGQRRGIGRERLVMAVRLPYPLHLGRLGLADLFLDTLPFNAGATASDALWAGVPVLSCVGEAFAARMAGSLLRTIGLPELIARSPEEYEQRALELAREPERLAELKRRLIANRSCSPLFDTRRFCRHLETAYEHMWRSAERGESPASFTVEPIPVPDPGAPGERTA